VNLCFGKIIQRKNEKKQRNNLKKQRNNLLKQRIICLKSKKNVAFLRLQKVKPLILCILIMAYILKICSRKSFA
jgi:hypothetical protein